jgi:hypothetical protein
MKKAFESLYSGLESKWSIKTKQLCFTGWLNYSKQKKMLKAYL